MHKLIEKYMNAYQNQAGTPTEKVKQILMHYVNDWEWSGSETTVADLIDDTNITAEDIVDYLSDTYEYEGGNEEFHYTIRALQICLRKAELANISAHQEKYDATLNEAEKEEGFDDESYRYLAKNHGISSHHGHGNH